MYGPVSPSESVVGPDLPASVRVQAALSLSVSGRDGTTRIAGRREEGAFRFRFPHGSGPGLEAMLVNIAGGLAGGDRLAIGLEARSGAALTLSSAAAERIYRSAGAQTELRLTCDLDDASTMVLLPQETILQQGARLEQAVEIGMSGCSQLLFGKILCFGRRAAGEVFTHGKLSESWRVRRDHRLIVADFVRLDEPFAEALARPAGLGAGAAIATLLLVAPEAGERLAGLRAALAAHAAVESGASDLGGLVIARLLAEDAAALRAAYLAAVVALAPASARLPRTLLT